MPYRAKQKAILGLPSLVICIVVLSVTNSRSEDLTTLDGKTYLNITYITNYPNQIVFRYEGERTYVAVSNLPADFLTKHGITLNTIKTSEIKVADTPISQSPLNPADLFLLQNHTNDLFQTATDFSITNYPLGAETSRNWFLSIGMGQINLTAWTQVSYSDEKTNRSRIEETMCFNIGQEELFSGILKKFMDWDEIAATNHVENFEKELARGPVKQQSDSNSYLTGNVCVYNFIWQEGKSSLDVQDPEALHSGYFWKDDIIHFQKLLNIKHFTYLQQENYTCTGLRPSVAPPSQMDSNYSLSRSVPIHEKYRYYSPCTKGLCYTVFTLTDDQSSLASTN